MTDELIELDAAVLPLIRSRKTDLWRYSAANEQGVRMQEGVMLLRTAATEPESLAELGIAVPSPDELHRTVHKALASAIRIIARADDSAGIIGDACNSLIKLHPATAADAHIQPLKLADWVFDFHFNDQVDYFELDPVAYAPALGDKGVQRLRERAAGLREGIKPQNPGEQPPGYSHTEFIAKWFEQRFAVLDRDPDEIIRTHLKDGTVAAWYEDVAEAFEEIARFDLAIEWAEKATLFAGGFQSQRASGLWLRLLEQHRREDLLAATRTVFKRWPSVELAERLLALAGDGVLGEVQSAMADRPWELVRFQLSTMKDPRLAWETAKRLELSDHGLWEDLAEAYLEIDAPAAIRVQVELVASSLVEADTRKYRPAARKLLKIRKTASATGDTEALRIVDSSIAALRERYKRRPSLLRELDKAGLTQ